MNFFKRLWNVISNRAHGALDRIESPDDKLKHFLNELQGKIGELQSSVTGAIVEEKKLQRSLEQQLSEARKWEDRARLALQDQKEDLARQALIEQQQILAVAEATKSSLQTQQLAVTELKKSLFSSKEKLNEAKRQYQLAMARYKSAETKVKLAEVSSKTNNESPLKLLQELDDKILQLETQAESELAMAEHGLGGGAVDLEAQFRQLERGKDIDKQLEALRLSSGTDPGQDLKRLLDGK